MKRRLAKNTGINYAKTGVVYALRLALVPVMLDALGPTLFGIYVLVGSVSDASNLVQSGLGLSIAKYTAECDAKQDVKGLNRIVSSAMLVSLVITALIVAGYLAFFLTLFTRVFNIPVEHQRLAVTYALLTLPAFFISSVGTLYMRLFEGHQRYDILAAFEIASTVATFVLTVAVLRAGYGLTGLAVAGVAASVAMLVAVFITARRAMPHVSPQLGLVDRDGIKQTAGFSWSAIALKSLAFAGDRTNPWIIGAILPVAALAPYSIASKFHEGAKMSATLAASALMPVASGLSAREETERLTVLHLRSVKYTTAVALPVILSGMVLAQPLILHWVGSEYLLAVPLAQAYLAYLILGLQTNPTTSLLLGMGQHQRLIKYSVAATVINVIVSIAACLRFGAIGVIIGSGVAGLIMWGSALATLMGLLGARPGRYVRESMLAPYGLAVPVYLALWAFAKWLPPANLLAVVGYAAVAWALYMAAFVYYALGPGEQADVGKLVRAVADRIGFGRSR